MNSLENFTPYIEKAMKSWHCPGTAVAIVKEDEVLYQKVFGLRNVKAELALTEDSRFPMASVTKSFTAMSVALLVDEGKLEWDKPVRDYMPEFILDDPYVTQHVTVRDMLSHRTGLPRHDLSAWRLDVPRTEYVKRMKHFKFSATFREKFQYNNLMYYMTAYLVEKVSGQRWEAFMQERIFEPLGMTASNFQPEPPQPGQITAVGYRVDWDEEGQFESLVQMPYGLHTELSPSSGGALFSSLADLTQWLKVHVNQGQAGDLQIVSANNLKQMHLPQMIIPGGGYQEALMGTTIFTYGLGWFVEPYRDYTLVHHGGNVEGFSLIIGFVPQAKVGVIGLTNIAMMPLRDVLLYEGIDRALGLEARDWNGRFHAMFDPIIQAIAQDKRTAAVEKIENAPLTHSPESYTGTFAAKGYPDFAVRATEAGYQARLVGSLDWSQLRHYHFNVFEWYLADFDSWLKVRFLVNDNGEIVSVSIPIEPAVDNVIFERKPLEIPPDVVAELLGEYLLPMGDLVITISKHDDKYYATQTGGTAEEITPYKLDEAVVGFKTKRTRFDFVREDGLISRVMLKTPGATFAAPRR